jgi:hypothetical protein
MEWWNNGIKKQNSNIPVFQSSGFSLFQNPTVPIFLKTDGTKEYQSGILKTSCMARCHIFVYPCMPVFPEIPLRVEKSSEKCHRCSS